MMMGGKKDTRPAAEKFVDWFRPGTKNFAGSGLSLEQFVMVNSAERLARSWSAIEDAERRKRLHYVLELGAELGRIKAITHQATGIGAMAIESLIEGDYDQMLDTAAPLARDPDAFGSDPAVWACFVRIAEQAHAALTTLPEQN